MKMVNWAAGAVLAGVSMFAMAGASDDASKHTMDIASGNVGAVMMGYSDMAVLQWVGGPLDGVYQGSEAIRGVWDKFAKGNAPLEAKIVTTDEQANPKGATVTTGVVYQGKSTIKVRQVVVYRDGKIVSEVWQVAPNLATGM